MNREHFDKEFYIVYFRNFNWLLSVTDTKFCKKNYMIFYTRINVLMISFR